LTRVLVYLGRFALILAGYVAASLAASAFMHLMFLGAQDWQSGQLPAVVAGSLVFSIPFVALFVAYFAFLPTVPVVFIGELFGRRGWLFYAMGGVFVGACVIGMLWYAAEPTAVGEAIEPSDPTLHEPRFVGLMIGAGIVGGIAYWLVAGRLAGSWLPSRTAGDGVSEG
jgi:hypothetical protein